MQWSAVLPSFLASCLLVSCVPREPPHWAEGGARLVIHPARWERPDADAIEITQDGKVMEDGSLLFLVDRAGRVVDEDYEPIAVLLPDGRLVGTDDRFLGRVGITNASPPHSGTAWLSILPDGTVLLFDSDGERSSGGVWRGCSGPSQRTCTLVTQIHALRHYRGYEPGPSFGIGVGIGVGY